VASAKECLSSWMNEECVRRRRDGRWGSEEVVLVLGRHMMKAGSSNYGMVLVVLRVSPRVRPFVVGRFIVVL
jgi:hypothetical protein